MGIVTVLWEKWVEFRRDFFKITVASHTKHCNKLQLAIHTTEIMRIYKGKLAPIDKLNAVAMRIYNIHI